MQREDGERVKESTHHGLESVADGYICTYVCTYIRTYVSDHWHLRAYLRI